MTEKFILIPADHSLPISVEEYDPDKDSLLSFTYRLIGCDCITIIHPSSVLAILDDEGLLKPALFNCRFTRFCVRSGYGDNNGLGFFGNVLLGEQGFRDGEPDIVGLSTDPQQLIDFITA